MIEHRGYSGLLELKVEDGVIAGRILGIRDIVTFEGDTVAEAENAFRDSVDDYLALCEERGVAPEKPFSGKFVLRIRPELHRALAIAAESQGVSLNSFVEGALTQKLLAETSGLAANPWLAPPRFSDQGFSAKPAKTAQVGTTKAKSKSSVPKGKPRKSAGTSKVGGK
ncbi:Predicted nuclease of the RNAse H fold, HicB family [Singulisphaera sp. GP187]|uniref:type II toxin-antitoxin system HicB family antitoxin n=1 Tax=Singulisphaera sp. GP187 TaxID=1882752 RepID=UPI00092CB36E|nr:type II toxin-antitoxin system HicB family antitoxin [Singulisphaera sp. GP187]SIO38657.1 Predicted nuclease of the RNAse H fold, HicB family [Singulisphaera sp. GP187]